MQLTFTLLSNCVLPTNKYSQYHYFIEDGMLRLQRYQTISLYALKSLFTLHFLIDCICEKVLLKDNELSKYKFTFNTQVLDNLFFRNLF